jgi:hypothetical protein
MSGGEFILVELGELKDTSDLRISNGATHLLAAMSLAFKEFVFLLTASRLAGKKRQQAAAVQVGATGTGTGGQTCTK